MMLHCIVVSHWLGAYTKWSLMKQSLGMVIADQGEISSQENIYYTQNGNPESDPTPFSTWHERISGWAYLLSIFFHFDTCKWNALWNNAQWSHMTYGNKIALSIATLVTLTHWGLVTPYGNRDLGQYWLRQWLVAWGHQVITWTNVDLSSVRLSDIHLRASSQKIPQPSVTKIIWKIKYLKFHSNFPGANELIKKMLIFMV